MSITLSVTQAGAPITITTAQQGPPGTPGESIVGPTGPQGEPGADSTVPGPQGDRGSLFLGSYATAASLPAIDGDAIRVGDYAYVEDTGELWRAA